MMRNCLLLLCVAILGCSKKEQKPLVTKTAASCTSETKKEGKSRFKMYEMSEMATLMERMYAENAQLKERIKNAETIGKFPNHFLKIHEAVMTDETENDAFFKVEAANFIKAQELIYLDPKNSKQHFNDGVDACVRCHEVKCSGPIPRIKKLYLD